MYWRIIDIGAPPQLPHPFQPVQHQNQHKHWQSSLAIFQLHPDQIFFAGIL